MRLTIGFLLLFSVLLTACKTEEASFDELGVDQFNVIDGDSMHRREVQIIGFSGAPSENEGDFFMHLIIVDDSTLDTFNLLSVSTFDIKLSQEAGIQKRNYFSEKSGVYQSFVGDMQGLDPGDEPKSIDRVLINKQWTSTVDKQLPTLIGVLGTVPEKQ